MSEPGLATTPPEKIEKAVAPPGPPDGGLRAWLCVLGGAICLFLSFGFINAFAVFESQYMVLLTSNNSASDIAWIGSFQLFMIASSSLLVGQLFDRFGPRPPLMACTFLYPFSCMMNSLAKTYWQIFICQGILLGVSIALAYAVPISCIPQYFLKKRGIATAIVVAGSSLGGVLWPIIVLHLLREVGYGWTWRIIGFMSFALLSIATLTISRRTDPPWTSYLHHRKDHEGSIASTEKVVAAPPRMPFFYLDAFKSRSYSLLCATLAMSWFGLFFTFFYLASWAGYYGSSQNMQYYSISILNAVSVFGRIIPGFLADKFGAFNMMIFCALSTTIIILCELALHDSTGVLVLGGFYGFSECPEWGLDGYSTEILSNITYSHFYLHPASGGMVSLIVPCLAKTITNMSRIGTAIGQATALSSFFALLGPPICGWILISRDGEGLYWHGAIGFSAACLLLSTLLVIATRLSVNPKILACT